MATDSQSNEFDDVELRQWISAWCDGAIDAADLQRLKGLLAASESAQKTFFSMMQIHARLQGQSVANDFFSAIDNAPAGESAMPSVLPLNPPPSIVGAAKRGVRKISRWSWAAMLLIAVLGGGVLHLIGQRTASDGSSQQSFTTNSAQSPNSNSDARQPIVARMADFSDDCQWYLDQGSQSKSEASNGIVGGETLRVVNGRMRLVFTNGTVVTLHAPALFQVISDMSTRVWLGKVTARVAKGAEGFSVLTPRATVIDLGTEFGIDVNELGATDLVVFQGEVNCDYVSQDEEKTHQRLRTGQGMHLDERGTASRIVSITDQSYSDSPVRDDARPPVITDVRDNIQRDFLNYYEIVQGGMEEDAKAFADREEHEWNGVTADGMPSYLVGGDYVKTFNNDKIKRDIEITVTLDRPAKLYVLFDKRIPAPAWLKRDFHRLRELIGVDEGVYCVDGVWYTSHHPGVGPGVSVDHVSTIWVRDIKEAGTVTLGPTESNTVDINMYGIVAVPMDAPAANAGRP